MSMFSKVEPSQIKYISLLLFEEIAPIIVAPSPLPVDNLTLKGWSLGIHKRPGFIHRLVVLSSI